MEKLKLKDTFINGLIKNNPVFVLVLGMCPVIAMSTNVIQAFAMGVATLIVLLFSNIIISALRNFIPARVRIPSYIIIVSTFVILVQLLMRRYLPDLYSQMRAFIALIVVNCIIFARAESFASCNTVKDSALDALATGLGFLLAMVVLGTVREIISSASFAGLKIFGNLKTAAPLKSYYLGCAVLAVGGLLLALAAVVSTINKDSILKIIPRFLITGFCLAALGLILMGKYPIMNAGAASPAGFLVLAVLMATVNNIRQKKVKKSDEK